MTVASPLAETPPVAPAIPADATAAAAPSAVAAPAPPEHRAAGPPPGRSGRRGWKRLGIAAGLVAAGAVGAVLAVVLLGGGGKGGAAQPTQQTASAASVAPVSLLAALMPTGIAAQCKTAADPELRRRPDRALPPARQCPDLLPTDVLLLVLPQSGGAPPRLRRREGQSRRSAAAATTRGEKTWIHLSTGKTGGLRVCGADASGDSMVVWTHEKLGSYDHVDMLGVARASSARREPVP